MKTKTLWNTTARLLSLKLPLLIRIKRNVEQFLRRAFDATGSFDFEVVASITQVSKHAQLSKTWKNEIYF